MAVNVTAMSTPRAASPPRRHDLDGLRAVAVLLVAVYHVWVHRVSGGVDVFLLLSGFFVGGSLVRGTIVGRPLLLRAYFRRLARRLLPGLVTVVGVSLVLSFMLLPANQWSEVARQAIASVLAGENWYLAVSGRDYGAADVVGSPFQHIWSLSVQTQLFIVLPFVMLALFAVVARRSEQRRRRIVVGVVAGLAIASFAYACAGVVFDQSWAYYDTFARAWEYLAGTLAALWVGSPGDRRASVSAGRARTRIVSGMGWAGLVAILAAGVVSDGLRQYPGPAALVPVFGAILLILCGRGTGAPSTILGAHPVARAGRYAYAFYLWHWPVLVFAIAARGGVDVGWLAGSLVLLTSAVLAFATHHVVERPFLGEGGPKLAAPPSNRRRVSTGVPIAVAMVAVLAVSGGWLVRAGMDRRALLTASADFATHPGAMMAVHPDLFSYDPGDGLLPEPSLASEDKPRAVADGCGNLATDVKVCSYGDVDADRVVAVVGGSHTEQWIDALAVIGEMDGFRVDTMIKWGCELIDGLEDVEFLSEATPGCEKWSDNALIELEERAPDVVFTTWTRPAPGDVPGFEMVPGAYVQAWDRLAGSNVPTIAIRDNPWVMSDPVGCVLRELRDPSPCGAWAADLLDDEPPIPSGSSGWGTTVQPLDMNDVICPDGWCPFVQGGRIVFRDDHHLTNSYAISMAPVLRERLRPLLPW